MIILLLILLLLGFELIDADSNWPSQTRATLHSNLFNSFEHCQILKVSRGGFSQPESETSELVADV